MNPELVFRLATEADLIAIVSMLADDPLGALRENLDIPLSARYLNAFHQIQNDSHQELTVAEIDGEVVGTFQLTFIPGLSHQGGLRAQVEAVRVKSTHRGQQIGDRMLRYAIDKARKQGCYVVQLTTDKTRSRAIQFYENLGFVATHEGMKLKLL